jgi:hypothetical protein
VIVSAWVLSMIYVLWANKRYDRIGSRVERCRGVRGSGGSEGLRNGDRCTKMAEGNCRLFRKPRCGKRWSGSIRCWEELFPAEQAARIVQLLVERVEVQLDGVNVRLRTAGLTKLVGELRERPIDCGTASQRRSQGRRAAAFSIQTVKPAMCARWAQATAARPDRTVCRTSKPSNCG